MRILIVGGSGLVGHHLARDLEQMLEPGSIILTTYHSHPLKNGLQLDMSSSDSLSNCLAVSAPDAIIWLAGSKNVSLLEQNPALSFALNERPIQLLIDLLDKTDARPRIIYLSSDYIYSGRRGNYRDDDPQHPNTVYGKSKVKAEAMLLASGLDCVALRTAAIMSRHGGFLGWLIKELAHGQSVSLFDNIFFSPTPPLLLSRAIHYLLSTDTDRRQVNFAGPKVSRYEIGHHLCRSFNFPVSLIQQCSTDFTGSTLQQDLSLITSDNLRHLVPIIPDDFSPVTCS